MLPSTPVSTKGGGEPTAVRPRTTWGACLHPHRKRRAGAVAGRRLGAYRPVHEGGDDRWSKILVGTDTSASADLAVQAAVELARGSDAELLALHVRDPNSSHDAADSRRVIWALHRGHRSTSIPP